VGQDREGVEDLEGILPNKGVVSRSRLPYVEVMTARDRSTGIRQSVDPLSADTLEPLARFGRKLPKDSNSAEDGFPGLINQEFIGSFSTNCSICAA